MMIPSWIKNPKEIDDPLGRGEEAVQWLRRLKHPKNPSVGHPFQLATWQEQIIKRIYGPRDDNGQRIVRRVILLLPRGNRKTSLAAGITMLHLCGPEKQAGNLIVSAASAHEQARELFEEVQLITQFDHRLNSNLTVRDYTSEIVYPKHKTKYKAVAADGNVLHGKTPKVVIADELHVWEGSRGRKQWEALDSALVKVPETLMIIASTSGRGQENLAWQQVEYAIKVQKGEIDDPSTLPVIFMMEETDNWQDEELWFGVNPGLEFGFPDLDSFRKKAKKAEYSPSELDSFLQYNLNKWLDKSTSPFVDMAVYDEGFGSIDLEDMEARQVPCWIGVDLSKNEDLTAVVACFGDTEQGYSIYPMFFCPKDNLRKRGELHGVNYISWAEDDFIIPTEGNTVDLRTVETHIRELCARFNVKEVAFDPTYGRSMMADLNDDGIPAAEFRQGWISMAPAVKELERAILARKFKHGGNPVLRWNFENIQIETDKAGNRMMHKGKSGNKIDGAVATAMAVCRCSIGEMKFTTDSEWFTDDLYMA